MNRINRTLLNTANLAGEKAPDTSLAALQEIYADLDDRTASFSRRAELRCPEGCGTCCSNFEPDITNIEAKYVALHLLTKAPSLIDALTGLALRQGCVFYDPDGLYHCTIYAVRPLVCRAFGFSSSAGKDGRPYFAGCKWMPGAKSSASSPGESVYAPPVMTSFGVRVSVLSTGTQTAMRAEVLRALTSLSLSLRLSSSPDSDRTPADNGSRSGVA